MLAGVLEVRVLASQQVVVLLNGGEVSNKCVDRLLKKAEGSVNRSLILDKENLECRKGVYSTDMNIMTRLGSST